MPVDGPFCRDCGARADVHYCPVCGQETRIEMPTVGHFLAEFAEQTLALQGQLWRTLYSLLFRPGQLTLDYVAGRRQRYVRPLRLYLAISISFFAVLGLTSGERLFRLDGPAAREGISEVHKELAAERKAAAASPDVKTAEPDEARIAAQVEREVDAALTKAEAKVDERAEEKVRPGIAVQVKPGPANAGDGDGDAHIHTGNAELDARLQARFDKLMALPKPEMQARIADAFLSYAPFAMFLLLPLFALFLRIGYLRRRANYAIHLLFAVNYHSFIFVMLLLGLLPGIERLDGWLTLILPLYLLLALRRVHGGGWLATGLFVFLLLSAYVAVLGTVMALSTFVPLALL